VPVLGIKGLLYLVLGGFGALFSAAWARQAAVAQKRSKDPGSLPGQDEGDLAAERGIPRPAQLGIGFLTDFLDTLGIGSFAVTTSIFKLLRLVPDRLIPGTLLVGHTLPTLAQAFIYITIIQVDLATLVLLISAAVLGAWLGAGVVATWPKRRIQRGMGLALLGAALVMLAGMLGFIPSGGDALALSGPRLAIGMAGNFLFGALMNIGIGAYAPSLIMFGLLGMNTKAIFPIMMGSCAFLMPVGGIQFVRRGSYGLRSALGLTLGGIPGVLVAAFVVRELPLSILRWFVVTVVIYTAAAMLRSSTNNEGL
jgi:uncharacterized membrane protein YfcA